MPRPASGTSLLAHNQAEFSPLVAAAITILTGGPYPPFSAAERGERRVRFRSPAGTLTVLFRMGRVDDA